MHLTFGSVCSGMEAASMAWRPLGWKTAFVAEIDPPACAVLAARLPGVPNLGDLTRWRDWVQDHPELLASIDVLIGGTPCQGFSFAGLRGSLSDDRSNLALDFLELADAIDTLRRARGRPSLVIVWENVPGVYSTPDNAFGCFLGALVGADAPLVPGRRQKWTHAGVVAGPARRAAWRTLDAQFFGVAQRRARVFVVASAGALCPAEVLLERASVRGNPPPRRDTRQGAAVDLEASADDDSAIIPHTAKALKTLSGGVDREDGHTLIPVAFKASHDTREKDGAPSDLAPPLSADADRGDQVVAFADVADPLVTKEGGTYTQEGSGNFRLRNVVTDTIQWAVRRLTPRECERLQGAPDDWTQTQYRGRPMADANRYKMCGNSMAVPVIAWIGERIELALENTRAA